MIPLKLSLVIPCFNEAANLPLLVDRCRPLVECPDVEVLLVDNGSIDETPHLLPALLADVPGCRSIRVEVNQGYGSGILSGLRAATGDVLGWTHADLQTNPLDAQPGFDLFRESPSPERLFVKGERQGRPLADVFFTAGMSVFETLLTGMAMRDINAQPTLFHRTFFDIWSSAPSDFSLDLYAYWKAKQQNLVIKRIPVAFGERAHGISHWNTSLAAKMKFIRRTVDYSLRLRKSQISQT